MKVFSTILLTYVLLSLVVPTVCNSMMQCSQEQSGSSKSKNDISDCKSCCCLQNCHCNFTEVERFNFQIAANFITKKVRTQNDNVLSTYLSEWWHPPEII